jgi:hypothetical protein
MSNLKELLEILNVSTELSTDAELINAVKLITHVQQMDAGQRDTIRAAYMLGPLDDGDVPSKSARDTLIADGYITKVVVKGEDGFNACTHKGRDAYKIITNTTHYEHFKSIPQNT